MKRLQGIIQMSPEVDESEWDHTEVSNNKPIKSTLHYKN